VVIEKRAKVLGKNHPDTFTSTTTDAALSLLVLAAWAALIAAAAIRVCTRSAVT